MRFKDAANWAVKLPNCVDGSIRKGIHCVEFCAHCILCNRFPVSKRSAAKFNGGSHTGLFTRLNAEFKTLSTDVGVFKARQLSV